MTVKMNETELKLKQFFEHLYETEINDNEITIIGYGFGVGDYVTIDIKINTEFTAHSGGKIVSVKSNGICTVFFTENPEL